MTTDDAKEDLQEKSAEGTQDMLNLTVRLPHEPFSIKIVVSVHETFNDIRQSILDLPSTVQYTCFSLSFSGVKLNDFLELSSVEGIFDGATLDLHEEAYNDRDARAHVLKVRDIAGLVSTRSLAVLSPGRSALATISPVQSLDFDLSADPDLAYLTPPAEPASHSCIKAFGLSHWNPPSPDLRLRGHLLYLQVTTLEGAVHHITSSVSGFYTNNSTNTRFDPTPRPNSVRAHSLLVLLQQLSPMFAAQLLAHQTELGTRDPLTVYSPTNATLAAPWLALTPPNPVPDISRTQEQFLLGGSDNLDCVRDWNEDLQSTREMPRSTIQERILRERLLNKLYFDFAEAAAKGAVLIARDEVPPLNPNEAVDAQIFLYNGIFFSYGADGIGTFAAEGGDPAARYAVGKDLAGVRFVNQLDVEGICPLCTVIIDYCGRRIVAQSPVPGIFRQREDGSNQIVYGGVDSHDVIADDPSFAPIFEKIAETLHLKNHTVWDKEGKAFNLAMSVETKGLEGTDGRKYILDLYRITPLDYTFLNEPDYPHKMAVLRIEAVEEWWKQQIRSFITAESEKLKSTGKEAKIVYRSVSDQHQESTQTQSSPSSGVSTDSGSAEEKSTEPEQNGTESAESLADDSTETKEIEEIEISGFQFAINPDAFAGQKPVTEDDKVSYAADEARAREVSEYVISTILPNLIADIMSTTLSIPLDSSQLTKILHKRGINMRYLGRLISLIDSIDSTKLSPRLDRFRTLLVHEIILRSAKHVANAILNKLSIPLVPYAAAHIFNCLLGTKLNSSPTAAVDESFASLYSGAEFSTLTAREIQNKVQREALRRFRHALPDDWVQQIRHVQLFRELSIVLGLQWRAKSYPFHSHKKKKMSFVPEDLLNIVPVIKDSAMKSQLAEEALEAGRVSIQQGEKSLGTELLLESLSLHEQVYGVIHPEVARAYSQLSMIYSGMDEKAGAVEFARKAVVIAERTLGRDASETVLMYLNLALCEHANANASAALAYVKHAYKIWRIVCGTGHPDEITTMNNAAVMLQSLQEYVESRRWFENALVLCEEVYGPRSISSATILFQLAQALVLTQQSKDAVQKMHDSYQIFRDELGPENKSTKEAEVWLEQLTQSAVHHARKDLQNRASSNKKISMKTTKIKNGEIQPSSINTKSIDELVKYIGA